MSGEIDLLEERLLAFGRKELELEAAIRELGARSREAGVVGKVRESDEAWELYQEAKDTLASIRKQISAIEVRLYSLRRSSRR